MTATAQQTFSVTYEQLVRLAALSWRAEELTRDTTDVLNQAADLIGAIFGGNDVPEERWAAFLDAQTKLREALSAEAEAVTS